MHTPIIMTVWFLFILQALPPFCLNSFCQDDPKQYEAPAPSQTVMGAHAHAPSGIHAAVPGSSPEALADAYTSSNPWGSHIETPRFGLLIRLSRWASRLQRWQAWPLEQSNAIFWGCCPERLALCFASLSPPGPSHLLSEFLSILHNQGSRVPILSFLQHSPMRSIWTAQSYLRNQGNTNILSPKQYFPRKCLENSFWLLNLSDLRGYKGTG